MLTVEPAVAVVGSAVLTMAGMVHNGAVPTLVARHAGVATAAEIVRRYFDIGQGWVIHFKLPTEGTWTVSMMFGEVCLDASAPIQVTKAKRGRPCATATVRVKRTRVESTPQVCAPGVVRVVRVVRVVVRESQASA